MNNVIHVKTKIASTNFIFFVLVLVGLFISLIASSVLPERFLYDADIIINNPRNYFKGIIGSYSFSIAFYSFTKLKYLPYAVIGIIQYSAMSYIFYKIGIPKKLHKATFKNIVIYLMFIMLAIYVSVPSKEFINFMYIAILVFLVRNKNFKYKTTIIVTSVLLLFLGSFFRPYYALVALVALGMYFVSFIKIKNYKIASILYGLLILISISLSYGIVKGEYLSHKARSFMSDNPDVNTLIRPPLETDTWYGETVSIFYGFFSVNLPINGLKYSLSPQIVTFIIWQFILFYLLVVKYGKCLKEGKKENYNLWLFYILFAYFIVQGIFEPDLGTSLRHKASVFPIIYYLLNYEDFRKKI